MAKWEDFAEQRPSGLTVPKGKLTPKEVSDYQRAHRNADTDFDASSIHHTLGTGPFQAASGSHDHANGPQRLIANSDSRGNTNYDSKIQNGWYVMDAAAANNPSPGAVCLLEVRAYFSYVEQVARHLVTGRIFRRLYSPNAWGSWDGTNAGGPITFNAAYGVAHYSDGTGIFKNNGWCSLMIELAVTSAVPTNGILFTVNSRYVPIKRVQFSVSAGGSYHPCMLNTSGDCQYIGGGLSAGWGVLGNVTYVPQWQIGSN